MYVPVSSAKADGEAQRELPKLGIEEDRIMSELKVHRFITTDELFCEANAGALYYEKSEADKVIALLSDKANYNDYAYKHKSEELADTSRFYEEELRHQKYKRCLAMAEKCVDLCHKAKNLYRFAEDEILEHHYNHKIEFFAR